MPHQRGAFLITCSQADLSIFKDCEKFVAAVVEAFGSSNVVEWAYCKEFHADGGEHFHMSMKFKSSRLWGPVKKNFMQDYVSPNFKTKSYGYVAASRYVTGADLAFLSRGDLMQKTLSQKQGNVRSKIVVTNLN